MVYSARWRFDGDWVIVSVGIVQGGNRKSFDVLMVLQ